MGNASAHIALILILIVTLADITILMVKPANAQLESMQSVPEFTHVTSDNFSLVPGSTVLMRVQLERNDRVEGSFSVSNFHYYPNVWNNGVPVTYSVSIKISDPEYQDLYHFYPAKVGSFNFTAEYSGVYTIPCHCSLIWLVENPITPILTINYMVKGTPMEINVLSPLSQTYKESIIS